jgi:hypothetical protein
MREMMVDTMAVEIDQQIVAIDRAAFAKAKVDGDSVLKVFADQVRQLPGWRASIASSPCWPIP